MLARIVSAVVAGLKAIGRLLGRVAAAPFRFIDGLIGGGGEPAVPPSPAVSAEEDDAPAPAQDLKVVYEQMALAVMQWCVDSLVADGPAPAPSRMSRGVAEWLQGLTREECIALGCADRTAVSAHLRSYDLIPGVRSVQSLERVERPPETGLAPGSGEVFSDHALAETEPWSAAPAIP